jgi:hypothetical protein
MYGKKERQHNEQKKKDKKTNIDQQNIQIILNYAMDCIYIIYFLFYIKSKNVT